MPPADLSSGLNSIDLDPCAQLASEPVASNIPAGSQRVLVADDHPANLKVVEIMLAAFGELVLVENGQKALEACMTQDFDVILMDMQMPVMDGLAATRAIRAFYAQSGKAQPPILMLTANALEEHIEAGRDAGANGHLTKPITLASLHEAIQSLIQDEAPVKHQGL